MHIRYCTTSDAERSGNCFDCLDSKELDHQLSPGPLFPSRTSKNRYMPDEGLSCGNLVRHVHAGRSTVEHAQQPLSVAAYTDASILLPGRPSNVRLSLSAASVVQNPPGSLW